jgi:hypothetical protein
MQGESMPATLRRKIARLVAGATCAVAAGALLPAPAYATPDTPLYDYQPVVSGIVDDEPSWVYTTRYVYWSVLAVRPPDAGSRMSLSVGVFGDHYWSAPVEGVNFIAVDSNYGRRPFGDYPASTGYYDSTIPTPGPPGPYTLQVAQGANMAYTGANTINWPNGSFVAVRDLYLTAGQRATVTMNPMDLGYVYSSDPANSATWVRTRESVDARTMFGVMRYTAPRTGYYGLVLVNQRNVATSTVRITVS